MVSIESQRAIKFLHQQFDTRGLIIGEYLVGLISDLHFPTEKGLKGVKEEVDKIIETLRGVKFIVSAGDLFDSKDGIHTIGKQKDLLNYIASELKVPIVGIFGNHDTRVLPEHRSKIIKGNELFPKFDSDLHKSIIFNTSPIETSIIELDDIAVASVNIFATPEFNLANKSDNFSDLNFNEVYSGTNDAAHFLSINELRIFNLTRKELFKKLANNWVDMLVIHTVPHNEDLMFFYDDLVEDKPADNTKIWRTPDARLRELMSKRPGILKYLNLKQYILGQNLVSYIQKISQNKNIVIVGAGHAHVERFHNKDGIIIASRPWPLNGIVGTGVGIITFPGTENKTSKTQRKIYKGVAK